MWLFTYFKLLVLKKGVKLGVYPMIKRYLMPLAVLVSLSHPAMANDPGRLKLDSAISSELTLYPDKALVKQDFKTLPASDGTLVLEGFGRDWRESSFELEYHNGDKRFYPEKLWWRRGGLDRDSLYSKLVGRPVELMGGGINVPVQGELLVYDAGVALVQGNNGRQYVVDWNDAQGVRLASREPVFTGQDYADRMIAEFGDQKPEGKLELSYLTPSLSFSSQYRLTQEANGKGRLERQIIIRNDSTTDYKDAKVRLVAGDTNAMPVAYSRRNAMLDAAAPAAAEYGDERVGEMLVTQLPGTTLIKSHSSLQMTQYKQESIQFEKLYVLDVHGRSYGGRSPELERPRLVLRFKAGADLPAGRVEMYENSSDGSTILSGGAWLPETIKGDRARLTMGEALAVRVERKKTDSQQRGDELQTRWQTTIYNDQKKPVTFMLNDRDRSLLKLSDVQGGKLEGTSVIQVKIPAGGQKQITYVATYGR